MIKYIVKNLYLYLCVKQSWKCAYIRCYSVTDVSSLGNVYILILK